MDQRGVEELRAFYYAHRQELFAYACSLSPSREAAEDAVQAAFAQVLQRARLPEELRPYLFRCVRNAAIDERRRATRRAQFAEEIQVNTPQMMPGFTFDVKETLRPLGEQERQAVVLHIFSGLTFQEIAAAHDVSINTAASWYRRGIEKLRKCFEEVSP